MKTQDSNLKFIKARNKVKKLKAFYIHLTVFIVVNTLITAVKIMNNISHGETFNEAFFDFATVITWLVWGIAIALHVFSLFGLPMILAADWEDRKFEKYMEDELHND